MAIMRTLRVLASHFHNQLGSLFFRHHHVGQQHIGHPAAQNRKGFAAVAGDFDQIASPFEDSPGNGTDHHVVIYYENRPLYILPDSLLPDVDDFRTPSLSP